MGWNFISSDPFSIFLTINIRQILFWVVVKYVVKYNYLERKGSKATL